MRLADALRIRPGISAAFTGAGGKSSAIRRLAQELAPQGPVLITTTTRLGLDQSDMARHHLVLTAFDDLHQVPALLEEHNVLLVTGPLDANASKWVGLEVEEVNALRHVPGGRRSADGGKRAALLIEADGARGRSWKAPADHEPAVPTWVDLVVPMVGLDVIGQQIGSDLVHRSEILARELAMDPADLVTPVHVSRLLSSPRGGRKGIPENSEVRVFLNKAESEGRIDAAREIAGQTLRAERIAAVVLGSAQSSSPALECWGRVAGVVLAAGGSSRLGTAKQLIDWRGRPLVWQAVRAALEAGLAPIVVVTGAAADAVATALAGEAIEVVYNPRWQNGQSTSVIAGLEAVEGRAEAICFLLADMPRVPAELIRQEVEVHRRTLNPIVAPWAGGRWANPAVFDRAVFGDLRGLVGDRGGRALFERYPVLRVEWDDSILLDIDTPEDLGRLERLP